MLRNIKRDYLQQIIVVKHEKFQKLSRMECGAEAEACYGTAIGSWRLTGTFVVTADVLSDVHNVSVFGADFPCG